MLVTFYDPHPGMGGAQARIPGAIRKVALELENSTMEMDDAVKMLKETGHGDITIADDCIICQSGSFETTRHAWRVIRFLKNEAV